MEVQWERLKARQPALIPYKLFGSVEARQKLHSVLERVHPRYVAPREKRGVFENLCLSRRVSSLLNGGAQSGCDSVFVECKVGVDYSGGGETDGRKRPRGVWRIPRPSLLFAT
jgi:hypothetical protein